MNKFFVLSTLCITLSSSVLFARINTIDTVPHASYLVYDNGDSFFKSGSQSACYVTYYTAQGDQIKRVNKLQRCGFMFRLDPSAGKPQPTTYAIKYEPAYMVGRMKIQGDFIFFYDKHGNVIKRYRFNQNKNKLTDFEDRLDLSKVLAQPEEHSYNSMRSNLKKDLFNGQSALSWDDYNEFLEPYLFLAEKDLFLPRFWVNNAGHKLCKKYCTALINYNAACFYHYATPTPHTELQLKKAQSDFENIIKQIKSTFGLTKLNCVLESAATTMILVKANEEYFKRLS